MELYKRPSAKMLDNGLFKFALLIRYVFWMVEDCFMLKMFI